VLLAITLTACAGDAEEPATTTVSVLPNAEFDARIDEICGAAIAAAGQFNPSGAVNTEQAAAALRGLAKVTFDALVELRTIRPEGFEPEYEQWLGLLLATARQVDAGATALQAGEVNAGIAELNRSSATSAQASEIGVTLGLERCQFIAPETATPTTSIVGG
jgi:hypothetical protein